MNGHELSGNHEGMDGAEAARPVVEAVELWNPHNLWREVVLKVPREPGTYDTAIGPVVLKEVTIGSIPPPEVPIDMRTGKPSKAVRSRGEGVPGAYGRVVVDLSHTRLAGYATQGPELEREVVIHRKGVGSKQLNPQTRLWIDLGERLAPPTKWERPTRRWSRWTPVARR